MKKKIKKKWEHSEGGCLLRSTKIYPCNDSYINEKTKRRFTVFSTQEAHFKMPNRVSSKDELLKIKGISRIDK